MTYDLQTVKAPRVAGMALSAAVTLAENPLTRGMFLAKLLQDGVLPASMLGTAPRDGIRARAA